jgi:hypothetical protein
LVARGASTYIMENRTNSTEKMLEGNDSRHAIVAQQIGDECETSVDAALELRLGQEQCCV